MKKWIAIFLALVMLLGLCACSGTTQQESTSPDTANSVNENGPDKDADEKSSGEPIVVKIGLISPLTGDMAEKGLNQEMAATLAVDEINENGGVLNGKYVFELISDFYGIWEVL